MLLYFVAQALGHRVNYSVPRPMKTGNEKKAYHLYSFDVLFTQTGFTL